MTGGIPQRPTDPSTGLMQEIPRPFLLMVDRGGCSYVEKARIGQQAGAVGVVVADTTYNCDDLDASLTESCQLSPPLLQDDGSGSDIVIPSVLLPKVSADIIKAELKADRKVEIELSFSVPTANSSVVEYQLWTSPGETESAGLLQTFGVMAEALGPSAKFTPHMKITSGVASRCVSEDGENLCSAFCVSGGRYCATPQGHIPGSSIVVESLRRSCIWKLHGFINGVGKEWWEYTSLFQSSCNTVAGFSDETCISQVLQKSGVDERAVDRCMEATGGVERNTKNTQLELEIEAQEGVNDIGDGVVIPTVFVNNDQLNGALTASNVFAAICSGFPQGSIPAICEACARCRTGSLSCVKRGNCLPRDITLSTPAPMAPSIAEPSVEITAKSPTAAPDDQQVAVAAEARVGSNTTTSSLATTSMEEDYPPIPPSPLQSMAPSKVALHPATHEGISLSLMIGVLSGLGILTLLCCLRYCCTVEPETPVNLVAMKPMEVL